ncbi:MAG: FMN-binding protein [Planctomycetota bacterium]
MHSARVTLVIALVLLLPPPRPAIDPASAQTPPKLEQIREVMPAATRLEEVIETTEGGSSRQWIVWGENEIEGTEFTLGTVARTLPEASAIVGYRGPTEAMIVTDANDHIVGVRLLQSDDTDEHVSAVAEADSFFDQFNSWDWSGPPEGTEIDGVSNATLTSLALAKGVLARIGQARASLVFPDDLSTSEINEWSGIPSNWRRSEDMWLADHQNTETSDRIAIVRSGTLSDSVTGYQGPTELLLKLAMGDETKDSEVREWRVLDIGIRSSYDNQPYVGYCKQEYGFWLIFEEQTLSSLAAMDLEEAGVEGVSGATMTSMAIAETLIQASGRLIERRDEFLERQRREASPWWSGLLSVYFSTADLACFGILISYPVFRNKKSFKRGRLRQLWLLAVVCVIGLWSGNLVSLALLSGWGTRGVAWQLAPMLAAIAFIAVTLPPLTKSNFYCSHLCPHGALQQLVRPSTKRRSKGRRLIRLPRELSRWLTRVPGVLLVVAYLTLLFRPQSDLSSWEPFHAYLFRIAPWFSICFAAATLLLSARLPMAYCRMGCPTGHLLDYIRQTAASDRIRFPDIVAVVLLMLAIAVAFFR